MWAVQTSLARGNNRLWSLLNAPKIPVFFPHVNRFNGNRWRPQKPQLLPSEDGARFSTNDSLDGVPATYQTRYCQMIFIMYLLQVHDGNKLQLQHLFDSHLLVRNRTLYASNSFLFQSDHFNMKDEQTHGSPLSPKILCLEHRERHFVLAA